MILFEDALAQILEETLEVSTERVELGAAAGRFLASAVASPIDAPPFDKAAMDGYAVVAADTRDSYQLRETIAAGQVPSQKPLRADEAAKIMTGAPLPPGAGRVIRVEFTECSGDTVTINEPEPYVNVILQGENIRAGDSLLLPGRLTAKEIGILAAAGIAEVEVFGLLRIGVITTGSELRPPGAPLGAGEIYDSNGPQLIAQIENAGAQAVPFGTVADDPGEHRRVISRALEECDIVLLSGGVSKGDFDYVPGVLRDIGVEIKFHGVRVKPGRPTLFGRNATALVFGLPGNPVSTFVMFEVLVRPLIHRLQQAPFHARRFTGRLTQSIKRKDTERAEFYPAVVEQTPDGVLLAPVRYGGSSHLNALAAADALVSIPAGTGQIAEGELVAARLI